MNPSTIITLKQLTPIIDAVFGYHNLYQVTEHSYRISFTSPVNWNDVQYNLNNIIPTLGLKPTSTWFVADYFDSLIPQMLLQPKFSQQHVSYLLDSILMMYNNPFASLQGLFKIALAFDDGHGLNLLKNEFTNLYLSKELSLSLDVSGLFEFADQLSQALQVNNIKVATRLMSEYILAHFCQLSNFQLKEQLIKQIAKKMPAIYEAMEEAKMLEDPIN